SFFQAGYLAQTPQVALSLAELGARERLDEVPAHGRPHGSAAQAEDVHVIVLDARPGREVIVDQRGSDARDLVGTDRGADAAAALCPPAVPLSRHHGLGEWEDEIRIVVVRTQGVSTEIDDLMPRRAEPGNQLLFRVEPTVIGGDAHAHFPFSLV